VYEDSCSVPQFLQPNARIAPNTGYYRSLPHSFNFIIIPRFLAREYMKLEVAPVFKNCGIEAYGAKEVTLEAFLSSPLDGDEWSHSRNVSPRK
jgi:hypothetical protein